jgi:hypothetical protein
MVRSVAGEVRSTVRYVGFEFGIFDVCILGVCVVYLSVLA